MDNDNQQIPGFGFDPGYEPKPLPPLPTPSSSSLFGLISKVNKGILKKPQMLSESGKEVEGNQALQQAKAIAKKLSDISPQVVQQRAFQNAKTTIENIQKGIWSTPAGEQNKQSSSDTEFKVPTVISAPKQGILPNKGQVLNVTQGQGYGVAATRQQTNTPQTRGTGKSLVGYNEDSLKQSSNFTRQEALNEIDRYRGPARSYNRDQSYEESRKKAEPFKSDFDRYYYGNETQRSEIADKLYKTDLQDDFNTGKDYISKQFKEPSQGEGDNSQADYKAMGETHPRNNYHSSSGKFERHENDSYGKSGNDSYHTSVNENYQRPVSSTDNYQRSGNGNYERTESDNYQKNFSRDYGLMNESNPRKDNFVQRNREENATDSRNYSRGRASGPYGRSWVSDKQQNEESMRDNNTYLKGNRTRNIAPDLERDSRSRDSWEQPDRSRLGQRERQSPTAFDYGCSTHTYSFQGSYRTSRHVGDNEDRYDHLYRQDRGSRDEDRGRDRARLYDDRNEQYLSRGDRDYYTDRYYDRDKDDIYSNWTDDNDDDMANMEELSEEEERIDIKSQDGKILYEDFLFGEDEGGNVKIQMSKGSHDDNRGDSLRRFNDFNKRQKDVFRDEGSKDNQGTYSKRGRSDSRDRDEEQGTERRKRDDFCQRREEQGTERRKRDDFCQRREEHRFGTDDRNLPITDDQKAQVDKPLTAVKIGIPQPVPPPVGVPPPSIPAATAIPPPGIICKDCNITCMDQDVFNTHLKSDAHILTLQRKAQELFHMESRSSRFDVDSAGNPLKATVLPAPVLQPTTLITGTVSQGKEGRQDSPARYRSRSDSGVQVIPPKPLGPLETRSVHGTWLILQWRTRHNDEEALIDKYVVEYRNAREIRWVRVGATIKHEYEVNGLQEGTDYLFRVYTTNREERSEYLESVLVTTKKRRDSAERVKRRSSRDRERDRGRRSSRERDRRSSRERDQKNRVGDRKTSGYSKSIVDRKRSGDRDRKASRDSNKESRNSRQNKDKESKLVKKKPSKDEKLTNEGKSEKEGKSKDENKSPVKKTEETSEVMEVDKPVVEKHEEVECLLYKEFPNYENEPMLGLDNIYEIRSYLPKTPPRYVCKLCNNKGSHKIIVKHIIGYPHKLNYFKKYNSEIYDIINMIAWKKQQVERANYEARLDEDKLGRGSVRVTLMLNPHDNNGKVVYTDPVPVKAPPPARQKETGEAPEVYDGEYQSQFEAIYNEAVDKGTIVDNTLIGLSYIKELLHPKMEKEPKYSCAMCSVLCYDTTILSHLVGKKHRFNYLKAYHEDAYDEVMNTKGNKHQLLIDKIKEFAEKDGPGTIKTKVAKNQRMWRDKASKTETVQAQADTEAEERVKQEEEGNVEEPQQTEPDQSAEDSKSGGGVQAIKFGIKKNESQPTNVKPINVLEQEQANPKQKEAFDWNKENSLLQSRIHNETIIKSSRKSKFLTVYSEFFKRFPVIGMQWVTEFQKQDVKQEPWYMCFMCQQKLQWKSILDHVTSNLHRLNYMKKSDYRQKYNAVYHAIKKDKQSARPLIEQYSKEIAGIEGPPTEIEVMLELNVNTEAFKSVAKVQENVKALAASSSSQSIQINIASTSISADNSLSESSSSAVLPPSVHLPVTTQLSSTPSMSQNMSLGNLAQGMQIGAVAQQYEGQSTVQPQIQPLVQDHNQPPPLRAPPQRPPPLRPPPSATVVLNTLFPPPAIQAGNNQRLSAASFPPSSVPYQRVADVNMSASAVSVGTVGTSAPPLSNVSAAPGSHMHMMSVPHNPSNIIPRQPVTSVPMHRPPFASVPMQRAPPMLQPPQMGQILPQRPLPMPMPAQHPPVPRPPQTLPVMSGIQATISHTPIMSVPGQSLSTISVAPQTNLQGSTHLIGHKPPPWQRQPTTLPNQSIIGSLHQQAVPHKILHQSGNSSNIGNIHQLNTSSQAPVSEQFGSVPEIVRSSGYNERENNPNKYRVETDQRKQQWVDYDDERKDLKESQQRIVSGDRSTSENLSEGERGIKRYVREPEYQERNKRLRNDDEYNILKHEEEVINPQRSSYGRSSQDYDRRDIDERRAGNKDRDQGRRNNRDISYRIMDNRDQIKGNSRDTDQRRGDNRNRDQRSGNSRDRDQRRGTSDEKDQRRIDNRERGQRSGNNWDKGQRRGITGERDQRKVISGDQDQRREFGGNRDQRQVVNRARDQRSANSRDKDQRSEDSKDRRRSRSPLKSGRRRSPPHPRQRDGHSRNRNDQYGKTSELSPVRKTFSRDRNNAIHHEDRKEQSYHIDDQMLMEDYNIPLDEAKVEDLVRLYNDRVDDDYDNLMGHEGEFDDFANTRYSANKRDEENYGRNNEQVCNERSHQMTDFDRRNGQGKRDVDDYMYKQDTRDRIDFRNFDRYSESERNKYSKDSSDMYGEFSRIDYGRSQSNVGKTGISRGHGSENMSGRGGGIQRLDRSRDRDNYLEQDQYWQEGGNLETKCRNVEDWPREFRQEDRSRQGEVRRNRDELQDYGRGESHMAGTYENRRDYVRDSQIATQRYGYEEDRQYDEGGIQDDTLPDPSREEIDELFRRANTMVSPPCDELCKYEDEMPRDNMNYSGSSSTYQRGGMGRGGNRGWGPRSAK